MKRYNTSINMITIPSELRYMILTSVNLEPVADIMLPCLVNWNSLKCSEGKFKIN